MAGTGGFIPRTAFEVSQSIVRTYYLGHHAGALASMRRILSNISLIIECRDSRVPLTATNPLLESSLAGRDRIIVFTKASLSAPPGKSREKLRRQHLLKKWHSERSATGNLGAGDLGEAGSTKVMFTDHKDPRTIRELLDSMKDRASAMDSLTGLRALVVGMPNAGKSSLLNAMRAVGMNLGKVARTGASPGVTRNIATPVRVIPEDTAAGIDQGVYVLDTPGVFVPYVGDVDAMLKLSLVGCVKDSVVPMETVADYLLFHLNLNNPELYKEFCNPTNDAGEFLDAVATRTGKLAKGGEPARDLAATWIVQQWRNGLLGTFALDEINEKAMTAWARKGQAAGAGEEQISLSQAKKRDKEVRKARNLAKRKAAEGA